MDFNYEQQKFSQGFHYIIGCDEVGRGCLAGPVVAGAVILKIDENDIVNQDSWFHQVRDSKLLTPKKREELEKAVKENSLACAIGQVEPEVIDQINIHHATLQAMNVAVNKILKSVSCESQFVAEDFQKIFLAVDGKFIVPEIPIKQEAIVDGDDKIVSIAAASIVAKVYRDKLMEKLEEQYPPYGLSKHKGYATSHHRQAILKNGLSPIHRKSFCSQLVG